MNSIELQEKNTIQDVPVVRMKTLISNSFAVLKSAKMGDDSYRISLTRNTALGFFKNHEMLTINQGKLEISDDDVQGLSMIKAYIAHRLAGEKNHTANAVLSFRNAVLSFRKLQLANELLMYDTSGLVKDSLVAELMLLEKKAIQLEPKSIGSNYYPGGELGRCIIHLLSDTSKRYRETYDEDLRRQATLNNQARDLMTY